MKHFFKAICLICFVLINSILFSMSLTVKVSGHFDSISSSFVVNGTIDDKFEKICLPKLNFKEEVDKDLLNKTIADAFKPQDAVFFLYQDELGKPKRQNGMLYASDLYLKDLDMTYTGFLRQAGYKFTLSKTPAYEDNEYMKDVVIGEKGSEIINTHKKGEKAKEEAERKRKDSEKKSTLRVTTVYDVLPKGVLPPSIRNEQAKIASIIANLKKRPYKTEIIQMDPLRWAAGTMGILKENGEIDMAKCESQIVDMVIRVPDKKGWLTPKMLEEIKQTPCEYVLSRYKNGLEVVEGTRYLLHDIYFTRLKLSWEEWLEKHGCKCPEFVEKPEYASGVIPIEIHTVEGIFKSLDALSVCQINFTEKSNLVFPQEIIRVFSPKPRPEKKQIYKFLRAYTEAYQGKKVSVHLMVCPDGKSYTELGQKRAKRMMYIENFKLFDDTEQEIITKIKQE